MTMGKFVVGERASAESRTMPLAFDNGVGKLLYFLTITFFGLCLIERQVMFIHFNDLLHDKLFKAAALDVFVSAAI